ncbi:xylan esterase/lipase [Bifidobacterium bifidum]|nr:xylan esterase/lipase [Bifidobacterium bifidum]
MQHFTQVIDGIDGSRAELVGYVIDNSPEMDPDRRRPAILIIPGGGYAIGSDRESEPVALQFLAAGYQAFVLKYSCVPSRYPVALLEMAEAMSMIRGHADEWHVDAGRVAAIGFSAGGHLAANLTTVSSDAELRDAGYDPAAVRPDALLLCYPVITSGRFAHRGSFDNLLGDGKDDASLLELLSIEKHVDATMPPVFIWHTITDQAVPVENSLLMIHACRDAGVSVEAHLFPQAGMDCHSPPWTPHVPVRRARATSTTSCRPCRSGRGSPSTGSAARSTRGKGCCRRFTGPFAHIPRLCLGCAPSPCVGYCVTVRGYRHCACPHAQ